MSAQVAIPLADVRGARPGLSLVPPIRSTVSTMGFGLIIMALVAIGMGLVMVVTTSVAAQSKELSALRAEVTTLGYTAANLTTQLQEKSSSASLVIRATDAGMVPNPNPVFIRLSDNAILGEATPATGSASPSMRRPATPIAPAADELAAPEILLPVAPGTEQ